MPTSALALKLILILIPGGLATLILEKLTTYLKWEPFKFIINSILLGGLSYLLSDLIFYFLYSVDIKDFWLKFTTNNIPFWEIIRATFISLIIGFCAAAIENYKLITRLARKFKSRINMERRICTLIF